VPSLDLAPGGLDQLVVLHAGRAGRDARHAAQAGVDVRDHRVGHRLAVEPGLHQGDAARGLSISSPQST
jgi:hypothetical protein